MAESSHGSLGSVQDRECDQIYNIAFGRQAQ